MTDAPLTPAEAYVLLDPNGSSSIEAFKITLLFLVAMEVLKVTTVETRTLFLRRGTKPVVSVVRDPPAIFLAAETVDVVRMARGSEHGHDFLSLAQSAYKRVLLGPLDIVTRRIRPALVAREWLEPTEQDYRHTPAGIAERERVQSLIDQVRRLPALIDTNPAEAKAIVLAAGSLLLLVPELRTIYGKLAALADSSASDGGDLELASSEVSNAAPSERHHTGSLQFGGFDASVLDHGFSVFDSYFDASRFT